MNKRQRRLAAQRAQTPTGRPFAAPGSPAGQPQHAQQLTPRAAPPGGDPAFPEPEEVQFIEPPEEQMRQVAPPVPSALAGQVAQLRIALAEDLMVLSRIAGGLEQIQNHGLLVGHPKRQRFLEEATELRRAFAEFYHAAGAMLACLAPNA